MTVLDYGSAWKYTNEAQTGSDWTTATVTWEEMSSFPSVTTTTRYFRKTITVGDYASYFALFTHVKSNAGFILYINGQAVNTFGLPSSGVTASTLADTTTTEQIDRMLSTLRVLYISSSTIEVAVEVHASSVTTSGVETFDCKIILDNDDDNRRIDSGGTVQGGNYSQSGSESAEKIFDGSTGTKWCFTKTADYPWAAWKFDDGRRELINKYTVSTANDSPARDPKHWKIYGSMNGSDWVEIDEQDNITWNSRYETKTFIMNQYISYNAYKFEFIERAGTDTWNMYQFSEWNLMLSNQPFITPGISYPQTVYTTSVGADPITIAPEQTSGYFNWQINPTLPAGLSFSTSTGTITGSPTAGLEQTTFTVTATYNVNSQQYTTTFSLTVVACDLPNYVSVTLRKDWVSGEYYNLMQGSEIVYASGDANPVNLCLPTGDYTVNLVGSVASWGNTYLTVSVNLADGVHQILKARRNPLNPNSFTLSLKFPMGSAATSSMKYLADGTVPTGWTGATFNPTWETLNDASRPTSTQKLMFFTNTFTVSNKNSYHGYELTLKARSGVLAYLNGKEIYRRYLPEGDLTASTVPTGGGTSATWRSIVGPMSDVVEGSNVLTVAIVLLSAPTTPIDFDMFVRLASETVAYPRYMEVVVTGPGSPANLIDLDPYTTSTVSQVTEPLNYVFTFPRENAETVNVVCLNTNYDNPAKDPKAWTIAGSNDDTNWTTLQTASEMLFETRMDQYCFYMPTNKQAYHAYRFQVTEVRVSGNPFSLADLILKLENLEAAVVPDLSFTPSDMVGYVNVDFPAIAASSEYYTNFEITPALPQGLILNTQTGAIEGIVANPIARAVYTVSALNHLGERKETTISVTVEICTDDKINFSLEFVMAEGASACSFDLKDLSTGEIVTSRTSLFSQMTFTVPMCSRATTYALVLKHTSTSGWGSSKANVYLADGTLLLSESLAAGVSSKEYNFNPAYVVPPMYTSWNYLLEGAAPTGWNTLASAPADWASAMPGSIPAATSVTQYYYKKFTIENLSSFSMLDISVNVKAGAIVYLNGQVIRRINMPDQVDAQTAATDEFVIAKRIITGEFIQHEIVVEGENILALELHRMNGNEETNSFDASAILVLDNMYMLVTGDGQSVPETTGNTGGDKLFDNNSDTKFAAAECAGTIAQYEYRDDRREPLTKYGVVATDDCNTHHPSGWEISGSNDGETWNLLHQRRGQFFDTPKQQKLYDFFNSVAYNKYRIKVLECNNQAFSIYDQCDSNLFQLADLYFFTKRLDGYCKAIGEYQPALNGDASYVNCPALYEGHYIRFCQDGVFSDVQNDCHAMAPSGFSYPEKSFTFHMKKAITPVQPTIIAAEYKVTVFPSLPEGLTLDENTGIISGTPLALRDRTVHTVTVRNDGGRRTVEISIEVLEAPTNWVLIIIIAVVVVIVIVAVVVAIVMASKKGGKKGKSGKEMKKVSSKSQPKATVVKTKAEVKV